MGTSKQAAPQPPNPTQMAQQQSNSNISTAAANSYLNAVNQYSPFGSTVWHQTNTRQMGDGSVSIPEWEVRTEFSPEGQKLYGLGSSYIDRIGEATRTPFNFEGMPTAPVYDENARQDALGRIVARAQPQMDRDRSAFEQRLADQGIGMQDPAYRSGWDQFDRGVNDFRLGADIQAGGEAAQLFNLQSQARDRAIQERLLERTQPLNEAMSLMTGSPLPTYQPLPQTQIAPTDTYTPQQMAYQGQLANWQAQQQQSNAMMGGLFGLGSSALMAGMMPGGLFGLGKAAR